MLKVLERKTQKEGLAHQLEDGRYAIDFGGEDKKELAESTFKRLFTVLGEAEVETATATEEQPATEVQPEEVIAETEEVVTESAPEEVLENPTVEETPEQDELAALLGDAEEVKDEDEVTPESEASEKPAKPEKPEVPQRSVEDLGLNIKLLDWSMNGTRGGKTDKVTSQISIKGFLMEITEYDGYITDVRVFEENPEAPENDPDAAWKLAYKSPKMSLKDTLEWFGLSVDDMKLARKEITAIRKSVKAAHLEQLEEQKEQEEIEKLQEQNA
jgi:hypothetical protein